MTKTITANDIDSLWAAREAESLGERDRDVLIAYRDSTYLPYVLRKMQRWEGLGDEFPMHCRLTTIMMDCFMAGAAWMKSQKLEDMIDLTNIEENIE